MAAEGCKASSSTRHPRGGAAANLTIRIGRRTGLDVNQRPENIKSCWINRTDDLSASPNGNMQEKVNRVACEVAPTGERSLAISGGKMRNRIIIENRSTLDDINALLAVQTVMNGGRISNDNKQYCYYSVMTIGDQRIGVATDLNKASDRFVVVDHE